MYSFCILLSFCINNGEINIDGGPNKMTLAEAKEAFTKGETIC